MQHRYASLFAAMLQNKLHVSVAHFTDHFTVPLRATPGEGISGNS